jgi:hypothetical protein
MESIQLQRTYLDLTTSHVADACTRIGDDVLCVPLDRAGEVAALAARIRDTERYQAARMRLGTTLRKLCRFDGYIAARHSGAD